MAAVDHDSHPSPKLSRKSVLTTRGSSSRIAQQWAAAVSAGVAAGVASAPGTTVAPDTDDATTRAEGGSDCVFAVQGQ
jgi:hypothetical protein